jgi:hypothetical protein
MEGQLGDSIGVLGTSYRNESCRVAIESGSGP